MSVHAETLLGILVIGGIYFGTLLKDILAELRRVRAALEGELVRRERQRDREITY